MIRPETPGATGDGSGPDGPAPDGPASDGSVVFEVARPGDVDELVELRERTARWLVDRGIAQWLPGEFGTERMSRWVAAGHVHVLRRAEAIAAVVALFDADPEVWPDAGADAGYIHLLMVDRRHAGAGLGDAALTHAEERIRARGGRLARLDAVATNGTLHRWYRDRGYREVGTCRPEDPQLFASVLLEKPLL